MTLKSNWLFLQRCADDYGWRAVGIVMGIACAIGGIATGVAIVFIYSHFVWKL